MTLYNTRQVVKKQRKCVLQWFKRCGRLRCEHYYVTRTFPILFDIGLLNISNLRRGIFTVSEMCS